jgi:serine/threonine protein kinase
MVSIVEGLFIWTSNQVSLNELSHIENILYNEDQDKFKLGDLGLTRLQSKLSGYYPEGDSRFLAKEMMNDDDNQIPDLRKADIFSLGIMVFMLMENIEL